MMYYDQILSFRKVHNRFFTNAHPIHAIYMILRQREDPFIFSGSNMVLICIHMAFIAFVQDILKMGPWGPQGHHIGRIIMISIPPETTSQYLLFGMFKT